MTVNDTENAAPKHLAVNLLETAASPPRNQTHCPGWKPAGTLNQSVKSSTFD